jgi:leucyl-tRNA synthetase
LERLALDNDKVKARIEGKEIAMIKAVPNRLVNVAIK